MSSDIMEGQKQSSQKHVYQNQQEFQGIRNLGYPKKIDTILLHMEKKNKK